MHKIWQHIDTWLQANALTVYNQLQQAANPQFLSSLETQVGYTLPDDLKKSLLIHDGMNDPTYLIDDMWYLFGIKEIGFNWALQKQLLDNGIFDDNVCERVDKGIRPQWWNVKWLPIMGNGSGDLYCIDLDPTAAGTGGQIIEVWHDMDNRSLIAPSYRDLLQQFADDLEAGVYVPAQYGLKRNDR
jgi:cell wall assembly regulator SMI1